MGEDTRDSRHFRLELRLVGNSALMKDVRWPKWGIAGQLWPMNSQPCGRGFSGL